MCCTANKPQTDGADERREQDDLFYHLCYERGTKYLHNKEKIGEGMALITQVIGGWWKPRYLLDCHSKQAVEFMDHNERLLTVGDADIAWDTMGDLPELAIEQARARSFHFPSFVRNYHNNVAEVLWQLHPNGRYYMDDDGGGATDDKEVNLYGFIDRQGRVVVPFRPIANYSEIRALRKQAEAATSV